MKDIDFVKYKLKNLNDDKEFVLNKVKEANNRLEQIELEINVFENFLNTHEKTNES